MEQPLLEISFSSDDMKRHSYHGSSSYERSSFEDSSVDHEVCITPTSKVALKVRKITLE